MVYLGGEVNFIFTPLNDSVLQVEPVRSIDVHGKGPLMEQWCPATQ